MPTILKLISVIALGLVAGCAFASHTLVPLQSPQQQRTLAPTQPLLTLETTACANPTAVVKTPADGKKLALRQRKGNTDQSARRLRNQGWWPRFSFDFKFGFAKTNKGEKARARAAFGGERVTLYLIIALVVILVIAWPLQLFPEVIMWIYAGVLVALLILWLIGLI